MPLVGFLLGGQRWSLDQTAGRLAFRTLNADPRKPSLGPQTGERSGVGQVYAVAVHADLLETVRRNRTVRALIVLRARSPLTRSVASGGCIGVSG